MAPNQQLTVARENIHDASVNAQDMLKGMGIPPEVFERVATNALLANPQLAKCEPMSVYKACMLAAQHGLLPDGRSAALVPLKIKGVLQAQMWPMIGGLLSKVRENLKDITISAQSVYEGDEWEDLRGTELKLVHRPKANALRVPDKLVCVYAVAFHPTNPMPEFEVLYRGEIDEYRKMSRANKGPWVTHYAEMAEVRVLKLLLKRLPVNPQLLGLLNNEEDEDVDFDDDDDVVEGTAHRVDEAPKEEAAPKTQAKPAKQTQQEAAPAAEEETQPADEDDDDGDGSTEGMDPTVKF